MIQYLHADGDGVGDRLQLLLLDGDVEQAAAHSAAISQGIIEVVEFLRISGWLVHFYGGDEVFASTFSLVDLPVVEDLRVRFFQRVGCTLSIGLGKTPAGALSSLHRAKLKGRDRIERQD